MGVAGLTRRSIRSAHIISAWSSWLGYMVVLPRLVVLRFQLAVFS